MFNKIDEKLKLALFDVDETLLTFNSMHHFLMFFCTEYYGNKDGLNRFENLIAANKMASRTCTRETLNRLYYLNYTGINQLRLEDIGNSWFERNVLKNPHAFNHTVLERLEQHKKENYKTILVSGGFFASLFPLSKYLNDIDLLCVSTSVENGVLTGEIEGIQTIGIGKVAAVINHFKGYEIDWNNSYAYGDHISDLPMLSLVGNPVIIGSSPELLEIAKDRKWKNFIN